nr:Maltose/maltodextrin import ATP-binding protein MalK [Klebsiella pneumoniae]
MPAVVSDWQPERLTVTLAQDHQLTLNIATQPLKPGAAVTLGIRPEHLTPEVATGTVVEFQCEVVERLGNNTYLFGQCYGHDNVKVLLPGDVHFRPGRKLSWLSMSASAWCLMRTTCASALISRRRMHTS